MPKNYDNNIQNNLAVVRKRINLAEQNAGRAEGSVQLLAVSKTKPAEAIIEAYEAGQRCFGENYLQEALQKQEELASLDIKWHFIGPIQSNKTKAIAENFDCVHSVDRAKIARRLNDQRPQRLEPLEIFLQVNLDDEETKAGVLLRDLPNLYKDIRSLPNLKIMGLMAIPQRRSDAAEQQSTFEKLAYSMTSLDPELTNLSIGMSGDLEPAIAAGSTIVRIGTDIFGARE